MEWGYVGAVVVSGLVIVFVALILLIIMVWVMGKIFDAFKKQDKPAPENAQETKAPQAAPVQLTADEISEDDEVVAVIAAAVAAMSAQSGTAMRIKSIRPAGQGAGRSAWAAAAAREAARTF